MGVHSSFGSGVEVMAPVDGGGVAGEGDGAAPASRLGEIGRVHLRERLGPGVMRGIGLERRSSATTAADEKDEQRRRGRQQSHRCSLPEIRQRHGQ